MTASRWAVHPLRPCRSQTECGVRDALGRRAPRSHSSARIEVPGETVAAHQEERPGPSLLAAPPSDDAQAVLSVIIVNWNTRELLSRCIQSLEQIATVGGAQVLVVDNGSADGSVDMVRTEYPW